MLGLSKAGQGCGRSTRPSPGTAGSGSPPLKEETEGGRGGDGEPQFPELSEPHAGLPAQESTKPRVRTARVLFCSDPPSWGGGQGSHLPGSVSSSAKGVDGSSPARHRPGGHRDPPQGAHKAGVMATTLPKDGASSVPTRRSGPVQARQYPAQPRRSSNRKNIHKKEGGAKVALLLVRPFLQLEEAVPLAFLKGKAGGSPSSSVIQAGQGPGHTPFL